jgi:hypothetical protein
VVPRCFVSKGARKNDQHTTGTAVDFVRSHLYFFSGEIRKEYHGWWRVVVDTYDLLPAIRVLLIGLIVRDAKMSKMVNYSGLTFFQTCFVDRTNNKIRLFSLRNSRFSHEN